MTLDESLDDDAPTRARLSTRARWLVGIGLAALIGLASVWGWWIADQPVRWQEVGFEIISPTAATVTYDVFLYGDQPATCHLRALNVRFAEVGVTTAHFDPADGAEQRVTTPIVTTEEATTALVHYCEAD
ncbi:MAG: DUF4307 domain-containing protein [Demequina sp.]|uniref:DUF4307 domain-containing protein n=1 Tax=Demequina sp. TaxID=2050685 RepID=UPI00198D761B|nr:DUF4307 domain-containing protein [Demequina sp.]MBC7297362.1 DUF4307 domain-containing protein [Demequina sp.]